MGIQHRVSSHRYALLPLLLHCIRTKQSTSTGMPPLEMSCRIDALPSETKGSSVWERQRPQVQEWAPSEVIPSVRPPRKHRSRIVQRPPLRLSPNTNLIHQLDPGMPHGAAPPAVHSLQRSTDTFALVGAVAPGCDAEAHFLPRHHRSSLHESNCHRTRRRLGPTELPQQGDDLAFRPLERR